ncbi:Homeobox protein Mohawk [Scophthalmus maximus]|uniref:Homeobox protein Mohawk n=1 Tax=Scophthalmus maximus TaxID=52904 RepID=A0A2U9CW63_SCOMX|nr:Homeobox protein Mohawk [Scophthalmus maximus]
MPPRLGRGSNYATGICHTPVSRLVRLTIGLTFTPSRLRQTFPTGLNNRDKVVGEVIDGQHPDLLSSNQTIRDSQAIRHRRNGGRPSGGKVRHKRQALQDMARPLKQWLYKHRDNPYPTKTEKILLALGSQMTLVQVSNWFANARRRLKNTVRQPDLSWALRIKLYNKYVQGNAERLSVSSDDSCSEDGDNPQRTQSGPAEFTKPMYQSVIKKEGSSMVGMAMAAASLAEDYVSPPKYKSSLLHRYLNDSLRHVMVANAVMDARKRNHSGSFSSNEYDDELLSPSSSEAEANFVYRAETTDHGSGKCDNGSGGVGGAQKERVKGKDETYWKEINAAMALTNLAQGKDSASGTTSCIIQKSSHIAEIKTVKVPLGSVSFFISFLYINGSTMPPPEPEQCHGAEAKTTLTTNQETASRAAKHPTSCPACFPVDQLLLDLRVAL